MGFHEAAIFPEDISYGSQGGPGFKTFVISLPNSGAEQRVAKWNSPKYTYEVSYGVKSPSVLATLRTFYIARGGALNGFKFKDFEDFQSTANGLAPEVDGAQVLSDTDVEIGIGDNSTTTFQLIKKYTDGGVTRTRAIRKPVSGSVVVSLDDAPQASGWTIDTTTGIITFSVAPTAGVSVKAGFQFYVPVRFSEQTDESLLISFDSYSTGAVPNLRLIELIDDVLIENEYHYGDAESISFAANVQLSVARRVKSLTATAVSLKAFLPVVTSLQTGGPYFYLYNEGSNDIQVRDNGDTVSVVPTLGATQTAVIVLSVNNVGTKVWRAIKSV